MAKPQTETEKLAYALAMNVSASLLQIPLPVDKEVLIQTISTLLRGGQPELDPADYRAVMQDFSRKMQEHSAAAQEKAGSANKEAGEAFLAENGKKENIKTTASGLQYEVLKEGTGKAPSADSMVKVHYEGKLLDGQLFDSSIRRGEPAEFRLNQVIPGWTEGLQLMKEGAKYRFFIPSELAYREQGAGELIGPHATLIFDVELISVK